MTLHQQLLLSLCHARYERAVKEATRQLMKEVNEVLSRMDAMTGGEDDQGHDLDSERDGGTVDRVDVARLVRDGGIRRVK